VTSQLARNADDTIKINDEMTLGRLSVKAWEKQSETMLERRRVKKNVRYQVNNTVGQVLNNADYII
jgi:hypothetical protein